MKSEKEVALNHIIRNLIYLFFLLEYKYALHSIIFLLKANRYSLFFTLFFFSLLFINIICVT